MKVLSYRVATGIPKANRLDQFVANGIVGERKDDVRKRDHAALEHGDMKIIIGTSDRWHIHVIPGEDLSGDEDVLMSILEILTCFKIEFDLANVYFRCPGISVNNGYHNTERIES